MRLDFNDLGAEGRRPSVPASGAITARAFFGSQTRACFREDDQLPDWVVRCNLSTFDTLPKSRLPGGLAHFCLQVAAACADGFRSWVSSIHIVIRCQAYLRLYRVVPAKIAVTHVASRAEQRLRHRGEAEIREHHCPVSNELCRL